MPSSYTTHYKLSQWDEQDPVLHDDFNQDNIKIDSALKAESDARLTLTAQVNLKASQSALDSEASARASAVSSLNTQLSQKSLPEPATSLL